MAEAGSKYGEDIIGSYSEKLVLEIGKKYNRRLLFRMRQFYLTFSNEKVSTMWTQLSWSHIRLLFGLDIDSINYYIDEHLRKGGQEKTIGIIVCRQDNKYIIRYCSDDRIVSREYKIVRKLV